MSLAVWGSQTSVLNLTCSESRTARWQAALPHCLALLTVGIPLWTRPKAPVPFEVLIGKVDLGLAAALSSSCGAPQGCN